MRKVRHEVVRRGAIDVPSADMAPRRYNALSVLITLLSCLHLASCTHPSNCAEPPGTSGCAWATLPRGAWFFRLFLEHALCTGESVPPISAIPKTGLYFTA